MLGVGGIELRCGVRLGRDVTLAELRRDHAAVFLGLGLGAVNTLGIDEDGLDGVMDAVAYIAALRQAPDLSALPVGRHIVVIGGGMTAIDIASQTKRLGAEDVTIVYRRGPEQMNASVYEQELAQTDGVLLRHWLQPTRLLAEARQARRRRARIHGRPHRHPDPALQPAVQGDRPGLPAGRHRRLARAGRAGPRPDHRRRRAPHVDRRRLGRRRLRRGQQGPRPSPPSRTASRRPCRSTARCGAAAARAA